MSKLGRDEISHSLSLSLSYAYRVNAVSTGESRCSRGGVSVGGWGGESKRKGGVEVEDKASSRASNSIVRDLLPIR